LAALGTEKDSAEELQPNPTSAAEQVAEKGGKLSFRGPILREESLLVFVLNQEGFFASLRMTTKALFP
jgi:hypothetical protein